MSFLAKLAIFSMEPWILEYIKVLKFKHMLVLKDLTYHVAPTYFLSQRE